MIVYTIEFNDYDSHVSAITASLEVAKNWCLAQELPSWASDPEWDSEPEELNVGTGDSYFRFGVKYHIANGSHPYQDHQSWLIIPMEVLE